MTISEYKAMLANHRGSIRTPADFESFWKQRMETPVLSVSTSRMSFHNCSAVYETLTISHDGGEVNARVIRPAQEGPRPLILMFHELNRGVRGWHHMTRFIAQGYCVIALEAEPWAGDWMQSPEEIQFLQRYTDALILANYARTLPFVDPRHITAWGEGFGGGLAIVVSALLPEPVRCVALNPFPGDIRSVCRDSGEAVCSTVDYVDLASFAPRIRGSSLFGVCLMDEVAKPEGQFAVYNRLTCPYTLKIYPKFIHERLNAFENEILKFLHERQI